ncbi:3-oxoacyl-reductase (plasmid) [Marinovum algicola DG 898]|nr:3-oxoacyl-reductase [Marinovum algicola DG 898]
MARSVEKYAVVTGTAGIGLGVARRLVQDGFAVTLCGVDAQDNSAAKEALPEAAVVELDVSDDRAVAQFAASLIARIPKLDALINCAGIQPYGTIETTTPADWQRVIGVNLGGYFNMAHFLYPLLKKAGAASVVNFASVQGHRCQNNVLGYATSKGAIHAFTRALAVDAARDGIRVNSVSPGSVRTPLLEFAARELTPADGDPEATMQSFGAAHPMGRVGTTQEIAALVSYLTGPESAFHTGADFVIDGGLNIKLGV